MTTPSSSRRNLVFALVAGAACMALATLAWRDRQPPVALPGPDEEFFADRPEVVAVDVPVRPRRPRQRIIHVLDWHYVPPNLFETDVPVASPAPWTETDIARPYARHLRTILNDAGSFPALVSPLCGRAGS